MRSQQLSESQVQTLHARLSSMRAELIQAMAADADAQLREVAAQVQSNGKHSLAELMARLNLLQYAGWVRQANDIERALADMRSGYYGVCDDCQRFLDYASLQADPSARRCGACQQD